MRSRILGQVALNPSRLAPELAKILDFDFKEEYSEYSFGTWRSYVLANGEDSQKVLYLSTAGSRTSGC